MIPVKTIQGFPEGFPLDIYREVCQREFRQQIARGSHSHLSGWKAAGAFRIHLRFAKGKRGTLIYKTSRVDLDRTPALKGLPVLPGPPEHLIYSTLEGSLRDFLPIPFHTWEAVPGQEFHFLLEDLRPNHRKAPGPQDTLSAAAALPHLHRAMQLWVERADTAGLIQYDPEVSAALLHYAARNLERFLEKTGNEMAAQVLRLLPRIATRLDEEVFHSHLPLQPIHGDYNKANILIHRKDPEKVKVLDWEWAGMGIPHADLASLLKRATPEIEQLALQAFIRGKGELSASLHHRLYEWCQLERGLCDAAFLAVQHLDGPHEVAWIPAYIETALRRTMRAFRELGF